MKAQSTTGIIEAHFLYSHFTEGSKDSLLVHSRYFIVYLKGSSCWQDDICSFMLLI